MLKILEIEPDNIILYTLGVKCDCDVSFAPKY